MEAKRLFVVDAMALAFRSFYAFQSRPLARADGTPTAAIFGSALFLHKLLEEHRPDYLLIASDCPEKTFRHDMYAAYKANRSAMPEDLAAQIPHFYRLCEHMGIRVVKHPGVEADDLIGTIAHSYASPNLHVYIVSGDKDLMQLVNDHVFMLTPKKGQESQLIDRQGVAAKFSCTPEQVVDCLALMGDSSDNVPGVSGIGEKGAVALIAEYGSLDNIFANLDSIANKRHRTALAGGREAAELSKSLVQLKTDVSLPFALEDLSCDLTQVGASEALLQFYEEMEFRNLQAKVRSRLGSIGLDMPEDDQPLKPAVRDYSQIANQLDYQRIETRTDLTRMLDMLSGRDHFAVDTETTGLDIHSDELIGISFAADAGKAFYLPLHPKHSPFLPVRESLAVLRSFFANNQATKMGHNLKFDLQILAGQDITLHGPLFDTLIASHLLAPLAGKHSLDFCCLQYLDYQKIPTASLIGKKGELSMLEADVRDVTRYACEDADFTLRLGNLFSQRLIDEDLATVANEIEMPLVFVLADLERGGVPLDIPSLRGFSGELAALIDVCRGDIFRLAGEEFNVHSPKQLQKILFETLRVHEKLGQRRLKKTKTGYSTDESVLRKLAADPVCGRILDYRSYAKLKNTYVDSLPDLVHSRTGKVHTNFHQTVTATGRLSSSGPNLQNIPIRTDLGKRVRAAFIPDLGHEVIISADYSQIELRMLAHMAGEENLAAAFARGEDIHTATAARLLGKSPNEVQAADRSRAKAINFGILYGMGPRRLAEETGISERDAHTFIERYFAAYPKIETYIRKTVDDAREQGFVRTLGGRKRPLTDLDARNARIRAGQENIAVNTPIQGSAADLIKKAMIRIASRLRQGDYKTRMLLQVHDELVFTCPAEEKESVQELIRDSMEHAMPLTVPTKVSLGMGTNWREAH